MTQTTTEFVPPPAPWEFPADMVGIFLEHEDEAIDNEATERERVTYALKAVLKALAWEMDAMPLPPDHLGIAGPLTQHVLHRIGDQGAG